MMTIDKKNRFIETFDPDTGFYARSGIIDKNGNDTGIDPFMRAFPNLIDVGIMGRCVCAEKCNVDCYQKAIDRTGSDMSLTDYMEILRQCKDRVYQFALGGAGDPDTHKNFPEILKLTRDANIIPNFTSSGIMFNAVKAELCKSYCGSVAISWHGADYTTNALDMLIKAGVKTNIHYVLSKKSIGAAIEKLRQGCFYPGINAIIFLLYKPIGLGKQENVLKYSDQKVEEFFSLVDKGGYDFKIGFDSCSCPGLVNYTNQVQMESVDFCEGGRFSMYIDADMNAMPCSFGNQDSRWFVSLRENFIQEAWDSPVFERFRSSLKNSCPRCKNWAMCAGGCPITRKIVLCGKKERDFR